jgi:hypothetical protein
MFSPYPHKRKNVNYFSHSKDPYFLWKYVQFRVKLPLRYLRDTYEKGILFIVSLSTYEPECMSTNETV